MKYLATLACLLLSFSAAYADDSEAEINSHPANNFIGMPHEIAQLIINAQQVSPVPMPDDYFTLLGNCTVTINETNVVGSITCAKSKGFQARFTMRGTKAKATRPLPAQKCQPFTLVAYTTTGGVFKMNCAAYTLTVSVTTQLRKLSAN